VIVLEVLEWNDGAIHFLDQTLLPDVERIVVASDATALAEAIRRLAIRGAPLIGIAAAYGVALAAALELRMNPAGVSTRASSAADLLASSRPTAVNLFWALERQRSIISRHGSGAPGQLADALLREARAIHAEDREMCERMAEFGITLLTPGCSVLTHCNTGRLATGGRGTALGVISLGWEKGIVMHVYMGETRPLLQGARLTAWEVRRLGIPGTLIHDSAAADLMRAGKIQAVLVGADRIAANGDAANKVGTYGLAVLARYHGIPFYVVAPCSSIDIALSDGRAIPIEERAPSEVTEFEGVRIAPNGTAAWAPAFDVTPAGLLSAIVTDRGIARHPFRESIRHLLATPPRDR
jgi:methylthioribose-1-phosphate isomerase